MFSEGSAATNMQNETQSLQCILMRKTDTEQIFIMQGSEYSKTGMYPGGPGSSAHPAFCRWVYSQRWWIPSLGHKGWIGLSSILRGIRETERDQHGNSTVKNEMKHSMCREILERNFGNRNHIFNKANNERPISSRISFLWPRWDPGCLARYCFDIKKNK